MRWREAVARAVLDQARTDYPGCLRGVMHCRSTVCGCLNESRSAVGFLIARVRQYRKHGADLCRHKKGGLYERLGTARHSETLEDLTVYRGSDGQLWARPRAMFEDGRFTPEEDGT